MKKLVTTLVVCSVLFAASLFGQNKFVGVGQCACHNMDKQGKQVDVWKKSAHAKAFETLKSAESNEIAKKKGLTKPAAEAPECLKCHVTGYGKEVEKTFKMDQGVQCEACHGAASGYKLIHNKPENKEKAKAAGLVLGDEKTCKECHNSESPTFKGFDYKKAWEEIKHPLKKG